MVSSSREVTRFPSFLYRQVFQWSWWPFHSASLLEKKGYKAIRVINSRKKFKGFFLLFSFLFVAFKSLFCFCILFEIGIISFADNLCFFLVFHFFEFSCWLSSTNNLIWIFVAFVAFIEIVSLWSVLVIVTGIPGLLAAKDFFLCSVKNNLTIYGMMPQNIYHFPFPIYPQQALDVAIEGLLWREKPVETMSTQA